MDEFEDVYHRHHAEVRHFALFLTGDPVVADDLVADTFVRAWLARDRIRLPTVRAYLMTIVRNLWRDRYRANVTTVVGLDERVADTAPDVESALECRAQLRELRARLHQVAHGDRHALLMFIVHERSYAEIATALGISIGAVKSRIARARAALRQPLERSSMEMKP